MGDFLFGVTIWLCDKLGFKPPRWIMAISFGATLLIAYGYAINWIFERTPMGLRTSHGVTLLVCTILGFLVGEIAWQTSGIRKFCYIDLDYSTSRPQLVNDEYQLSITSNADLEKVIAFPSPWGVLAPTGQPGDPYWSLRSKGINADIIHDGKYALGLGLPAGEYRIDFKAKDKGHWYEYLRIYIAEDGEVKQTVRVMTELTNGDVLYKSP